MNEYGNGLELEDNEIESEDVFSNVQTNDHTNGHSYLYDTQLSCEERVLYGLLLAYDPDNEGIDTYTQGKMGEHLGRSPSTVRKYMKGLEQHGYVKIQVPVNINQTTSNAW